MVHEPTRIVRIENFSAEEIRTAAAANAPPYDVVLAFSTKYEATFDITDRTAVVRIQDEIFWIPPRLAAQSDCRNPGGES